MTATDQLLLDQLVEASKNATAPQMKDDEFFELFCAQSVLMDYQLEPDEIKLGLIGTDDAQKTGSDGGLDGIYSLVNGRFVRNAEEAEGLKTTYRQSVEIDVILIQATRESGFSLARLLRLKDTMEDIFSLDRETFSESYNQPLLEAIATFRALHKTFAIRHPTVHVSFLYMTRGDTGCIAKDVGALKTETEGKAKAILATIKKCEVTFCGARQVFELASKAPLTSHSLKCSDSLGPQKGKANVALVKLSDYARFITDDKGALRTNLFDSNVRDYQGDVEVNQAIEKTLASSGKIEFWWLNNGITIVTPKLGGHSKEFIIDDPQVVNGLQTSQKIFDYFQSRPEAKDSDNRELLVRVIEVGDDAETYDEIIEATNSQTRMAPSSLWATKHIRL